MKIKSEAAEVDDKRLQFQLDPSVAGGGVDEFFVPRTGDPKNELLEAGGLHPLHDIANEFMRGFWIDAEEPVGVRGEHETQRR